MLNLPKKLRIFKAKTKLRNKYIAEKVGTTEQAIKNWTHDENCPHQLRRHFAEKLVELCNGEITLSDCGWE